MSETYLKYKGFYTPKTAVSKADNILLLICGRGYVRCDMRFAPHHEEMSVASTNDMAAALRHAAATWGLHAAQQIDISKCPTSTSAEEAWKVWFEPWEAADKDKPEFDFQGGGEAFTIMKAERAVAS